MKYIVRRINTHLHIQKGDAYTGDQRIHQKLQQGNLSTLSITKPDNTNSLADKHNQEVPLYKNNQQSYLYNMKNTYQPAIYTANPRR